MLSEAKHLLLQTKAGPELAQRRRALRTEQNLSTR
jgi:hypothetical protein